jgi:LPS-assembly protein
MRKQLLSTLILLSGVVNAQEQEYAISCSGTPLLFPKQVLSTDAENVDVTADHSEGGNGNFLLSGNASLNSAQYFLSADKIKIEKNDKTSNTNADGNVKFQDAHIMLTGDSATIKKQDKAAHSTFTQTQYHYPSTKINGKAKKIVNDGNQQTFSALTYSLCPVGNTDWQMKADKVTLNQENNLGVAKNVTLEFLGVPIFYSPYYEWTLKGRSSGFLAPSIGSYTESDNSKKNGYQLRVPYYFNIAANRDLLLTLNQLSTRGSVIEGQYRQLLDKGQVEIEAHYLNKDKITKDDRWLLDTQLNLALSDQTKLAITTNRVSDSEYFKEVAHDNTGETALMSSANITHTNKKLNLSTSIFAEKEQLLSGDAEYTRALEILIKKKVIGLSGREINFSLLSSKFKHKDNAKETGVRTHAQATFTRKIQTNAYSIQPKLSVSKTKYIVNNKAKQNRSIYRLGVDSKLFFERDIQLFGKGMLQTLTPRLAYNYTPGKDQSTLTNFDSELVGESYENLFSGKKFTGFDRINKTNDIVLGLESSFIDSKTGETYLTLKIAQARHLSDTTTDLTGNLVTQKKYSNIAMGADLTFDKITFNNAIQYNTDTGTVAKSNSSLSYVLNPKKFISLTHENDAGKRSAGIYGAYPLSQKVHLFAGVNRSLSDSITHKKTIGAAYESCCWALRVARFNEYTNAGIYDKVTKIELVLKGLASSDATLTARLKREIPNYLPDLNN